MISFMLGVRKQLTLGGKQPIRLKVHRRDRSYGYFEQDDPLNGQTSILASRVRRPPVSQVFVSVAYTTICPHQPLKVCLCVYNPNTITQLMILGASTASELNKLPQALPGSSMDSSSKTSKSFWPICTSGGPTVVVYKALGGFCPLTTPSSYSPLDPRAPITQSITPDTRSMWRYLQNYPKDTEARTCLRIICNLCVHVHHLLAQAYGL